MPTINWPWAIILCRFSDVSVVPQPPQYYVDFFTQNGTGGVCDYWRAVSCNSLDLTDSRVFGWYDLPQSTATAQGLQNQAGRAPRIQWGIDVAQANGINLAPFRSILVIQNWGTEHGASGNKVLVIHQNSGLCEFGFIAHEMGHGFGLPHSWAANPDFGYGDGWDLMSWQTTTFNFPISFKGAQGLATVGLNARNLEALNAVPQGRTWSPNQADFSEQITLDPVNQLSIGNHGFLLLKIPPNATRPIRTNASSFTVEFRRKAGWDQAIPQDAVLIHEVRVDGLSYLQPTIWGQFTTGQQFITPEPKIFIRITGIDPTIGTATIRLWDIPSGSLRKEDSKPEVFLIQDGTKRWLTSPQLLPLLGKSWSDVRVVPDGGLNSVPTGPDMQLPVYQMGSPGTGIGGYNLADPADQAFTFDYNSSGKQDHLVLYRPGTGTIWFLKNTGGTFSAIGPSTGAPGVGIGGYDLADPADRAFAFDYDGSGKLDHLVLYRPGFGTIWILKNNGGTFTPIYQMGSPGTGIGGYDLADPADRAFAFDYNSSGKLDHLVLYRPGFGTIWILKNNGGTFTPIYQMGSPGTGIGGYDLADPADRAFAFDYDGSGKLDHLALYRPGFGTIWILKNTGGTFTPVYQMGSPGTGIGGYNLADPADRAFAFDYDSSGKLDHLVLYRPGTGTIWFLKNTGGTFSAIGPSTGAPGVGINGYDLADPADRAFAFDYDGSGKLDHLVLYRPGTGTIWIMNKL